MKILTLLLLLVCCTSNLYAIDITFVWNTFNDSDYNLSDFRIHYKTGTTGGEPYNGTGLTEGPSPINVGIPAETGGYAKTLRNFQTGTTYFLVLTARGIHKTTPDGIKESGYTAEINTSMPSTPKGLRIIASVVSSLNGKTLALNRLVADAKLFALARGKNNASTELVSAIRNVQLEMEEYGQESDIAVAAAITNTYELQEYRENASLIMVF